MAGETRQAMVQGAARLLAVRGLQQTSFSEVLELPGAPRGSIYHHFPEGKDQLVAEAVDLAGAHAIALLDEVAGSSAEDVTAHFLGMWRELLTRSKVQAGCSVVAVTVATDSPDLIAHAAAVFRSWQLRLTDLLVAGGLADADASGFAGLLIAASEGAVVLSRAQQSLEPFEGVAAQLTSYVGILCSPTARPV